MGYRSSCRERKRWFRGLRGIPATLIAIFLSLPALLLLVSNRTLRIGAWVTLAAIATNILFFSDLRSNSLLVREWHCGTFWTLCW